MASRGRMDALAVFGRASVGCAATEPTVTPSWMLSRMFAYSCAHVSVATSNQPHERDGRDWAGTNGLEPNSETHRSRSVLQGMTLVECALAVLLAHGNLPARDSLPPNLVNDAKHIVSLLNAGHADSVQLRMTAEAQQRRTAAQRYSLWHVLVSQVGSFQRFGATRVEQGPDGGRTVVMELVFAAQPVQASVMYDADGRVSSVVLQSQ